MNDGAPSSLTRRQRFLIFVSLNKSPVAKALVKFGSSLLPDKSAHWKLAFSVSTLPEKSTIRLIWQQIIPVLARLFARVWGLLLTFPFALGPIIDETENETTKDAVKNRFTATSSCCVPPGFKPVHEKCHNNRLECDQSHANLKVVRDAARYHVDGLTKSSSAVKNESEVLL